MAAEYKWEMGLHEAASIDHPDTCFGALGRMSCGAREVGQGLGKQSGHPIQWSKGTCAPLDRQDSFGLSMNTEEEMDSVQGVFSRFETFLVGII